MKINVDSAVGLALDWLAAKCDGYNLVSDGTSHLVEKDGKQTVLGQGGYSPSTDPAQGWSIIDCDGVRVVRGNDLHFPKGNEKGDYSEPLWLARIDSSKMFHGPTRLIAGLRCVVANRLGREVEVPDQLCVGMVASERAKALPLVDTLCYTKGGILVAPPSHEERDKMVAALAQLIPLTQLLQARNEQAAAQPAALALSPAQLACLQAYCSGEFLHLSELPTQQEFDNALATCGDGLLKFLMVELSSTEDCASLPQAMDLVRSAITELQALNENMEGMECSTLRDKSFPDLRQKG